MERLVCFICLIVGYFFGCLVAAYYIGKANKVDIRTKGSGNLGTTNTFRTVGVRAGILTFVGDFVKVLVACSLAYLVVILWIGIDIDRVALMLYTGFGAVLGHNFPFYLKFKGGKGVAATSAVLLSIWDWRFIVVAVVLFFGIFFLTGYVSLSSLLLMVGELILFVVFLATDLIKIAPKWRVDCIIIFVLLAALMIFQHRENIKRLIAGTENKFSLGKKKSANSDEKTKES